MSAPTLRPAPVLVIPRSASAAALSRRPAMPWERASGSNVKLDAGRAGRVLAWDERAVATPRSTFNRMGGNAMRICPGGLQRPKPLSAVCPVACYQSFESASTLKTSGGRFSESKARPDTVPAVCPVASYQSMQSTLTGVGGQRISDAFRPCTEPMKSPWASFPRARVVDPRPWRTPVPPWREGLTSWRSSIQAPPTPHHRPAPGSHRPAPKPPAAVGVQQVASPQRRQQEPQQQQQEQQEEEEPSVASWASCSLLWTRSVTRRR